MKRLAGVAGMKGKVLSIRQSDTDFERGKALALQAAKLCEFLFAEATTGQNFQLGSVDHFRVLRLSKRMLFPEPSKKLVRQRYHLLA